MEILFIAFCLIIKWNMQKSFWKLTNTMLTKLATQLVIARQVTSLLPLKRNMAQHQNDTLHHFNTNKINY